MQSVRSDLIDRYVGLRGSIVTRLQTGSLKPMYPYPSAFVRGGQTGLRTCGFFLTTILTVSLQCDLVSEAKGG